MAYSLCALYRHWNRANYRDAVAWNRETGYTVGYPGWGSTTEAIRIQTQSCALIRTLTVPPVTAPTSL